MKAQTQQPQILPNDAAHQLNDFSYTQIKSKARFLMMVIVYLIGSNIQYTVLGFSVPSSSATPLRLGVKLRSSQKRMFLKTKCYAKLRKIASTFDIEEILLQESEFLSLEDHEVVTPQSTRRRTPNRDKKSQKLLELLEKQKLEKHMKNQKRTENEHIAHFNDPLSKEQNRDDLDDIDETGLEGLLHSIEFSAYSIPSSENGKRIDALLVDLLNAENCENDLFISRSQCGTLLSNECVFIIPPQKVSELHSNLNSNSNATICMNTPVSYDLFKMLGTVVARKSHQMEESSVLIYPSRNSLFSSSFSANVLLSNSMPPTKIVPQKIPLDILYEDECMIVLNKKAGMVVHPASGNWDQTVVNALSYYLMNESPFGVGDFFGDRNNNLDNSNQSSKHDRDNNVERMPQSVAVKDFVDEINRNFTVDCNFGDDIIERDLSLKNDAPVSNQNDSVTNSIPILRPGIVHRLDKGTTGVLVVAKTHAALTALSEAFAKRNVKKTYFAVVIGNPGDDVLINKPIGRHPLHRQKMRVVPDPSASVVRQTRLTGSKQQSISKTGRSAISSLHTVHHDGKLSIVQVKIATGRTHQIRVHLQDHGTPVYGDDIYGLSDWNKGLSARRGVTRPLLHAQRLEIDHPITGERMTFEADVADDMKSVMDAILPSWKDVVNN